MLPQTLPQTTRRLCRRLPADYPQTLPQTTRRLCHRPHPAPVNRPLRTSAITLIAVAPRFIFRSTSVIGQCGTTSASPWTSAQRSGHPFPTCPTYVASAGACLSLSNNPASLERCKPSKRLTMFESDAQSLDTTCGLGATNNTCNQIVSSIICM